MSFLKIRFNATPLVVGRDDIYIASNSGVVRKLSLSGGVRDIPTQIWASELGEKVISSPALADGYLYIADRSGIYFQDKG